MWHRVVERLEDARDTLLHHEDSSLDLMTLDGRAQTFQGLVRRLEAQPKCSVVHRDHDSRIQFREGLDCFFGFICTSRRVGASYAPIGSKAISVGSRCPISENPEK